jgi:hypothetical protein
MWIIVKREARPDAAYWPGRRALAAVDALVWPVAVALVVIRAPFPTGAVGQLTAALALVCAANRLHRALWVNHRYQFTTWRWGRVLAVLLLIGWALKIGTLL